RSSRSRAACRGSAGRLAARDVSRSETARLRRKTCGLCEEMRELPPKPFIFFRSEEKNFVSGGLQAEVTTLLDEIRAGKAEAKSQLVELVYAELHGLAAGLMRRERAGHTLQPTALVHEACLRLLTPEVLGAARNRGHF